MIERKIVDEKLQEYLIEDFVRESLNRVGHSRTELQKTPVGEKIVIHASRPGLIVGSKGSNIKKLTKVLKTKFKLDNPVIEISEIQKPELDANLVAENIAFLLERFGSQRFKGVGYSAMDSAIKAGAKGIEILISGKLPASRARTWRFYMGYLKKCGDLAINGVDTSYIQAKLKTGVVGIQVRIMPPDLVLPDAVTLLQTEVGEAEEEPSQKMAEEAKEEAKEVEAKKEEVIESTPESVEESAPEKKEQKVEEVESPKTESTENQTEAPKTESKTEEKK
ncbi:MAG: 30S ribosomal protein S3 [Candidatus Woesearchaeota archaeon]